MTGHHAEKDKIMGFCLFNNVAVAAQVARETMGVSRVLIIDWDGLIFFCSELTFQSIMEMELKIFLNLIPM